MDEKRNWPRVTLHFNVSFTSTQAASTAEGTGVTENVSPGGVFFRTRDWMRLKYGQKLYLQMAGMSLAEGRPGYRKLNVLGTVLRIERPKKSEEREEPAGVAVCFDEPPRLRV